MLPGALCLELPETTMAPHAKNGGGGEAGFLGSKLRK
jgi:hypothetical protein